MNQNVASLNSLKEEVLSVEKAVAELLPVSEKARDLRGGGAEKEIVRWRYNFHFLNTKKCRSTGLQLLSTRNGSQQELSVQLCDGIGTRYFRN